MPYRDHLLMHRVHTEPEAVKKELLETYLRTGSVKDAAKALDISKRSLWLYIQQLDIRDEFRAIKRMLRRAEKLHSALSLQATIRKGMQLPEPHNLKKRN